MKTVPAFLLLALIGLGQGRQAQSLAESHGQVSAKSGTQTFHCYDLPGQSGYHLTSSEYITHLAAYQFDNIISSCCFNGVWLMYDDANYNLGDLGNYQVFWSYGDNFCTNLADYNFDNLATSMRYAGAPNGFKYDTITLYEGPVFTGRESYSIDEVQALSEAFYTKSAIITGCSPWTIYDAPNYQGNSACLYPKDTANCMPGFFNHPVDLGGVGRVYSMRRGCYSKNKVFSKDMPLSGVLRGSQ